MVSRASDERLRFLLLLEQQADSEVIRGLGLLEEVQAAIEERGRRLAAARRLLAPLGVDLQSLPSHDAPGAIASQSGPTVEPYMPYTSIAIQEGIDNAIAEPYLEAERRALAVAPNGATVEHEVHGKRHRLLLRTPGATIPAVCRYFRCRREDGRWWFGVYQRDLDDSDFTCFLLCDTDGDVSRAVVMPHDWLAANVDNLGPTTRSNGWYVYFVSDGEDLFVSYKDWRTPCNEWVDTWTSLWDGNA